MIQIIMTTWTCFHKKSIICVNPFPNKPWFLRVCSRSLLKRRLISPFPTVFSALFENFLPFSTNLKVLPANPFSLEESKICHLIKG